MINFVIHFFNQNFEKTKFEIFIKITSVSLILIFEP